MRTISEEISNQYRKEMQHLSLLKEFRTSQVRRIRGSDEAPDRQKNKEPKHFGNPIKHSIEEVSEDLSGGHYSRRHFKNTEGGLGTSKNEVIGP